MRVYNILSSSLLTLLIIVLPITASAQLLEEIVVTAQKREQSLQDIGISITAFSGAQISALGYTNTTDIAAQTPGLNIQQFHPSLTNVNIRGVSQNDFADHLEPPIAMYVDDAYVSSMGAAHTQLFDVERVEVLRGPQGTLFGRNATGGLIHYVSRKPTEEFEGYGEFTYAENDQIKFEGAVSGALTDNLLGRLSVSTNHHDGYLENRIGKDLRDAEAYSIRGQFLLTVNNDTELLLKASYSDDDTTGGGYSHRASTYGADGSGRFVGANETAVFFGVLDLFDGLPDPITGPCPGCDAGGFVEPDDDPFTGSFENPGQFKRQISNLQSKLTLGFETFTLTSVSDYLVINKEYSEDTDSSPNPIVPFVTGQNLKQFSQELRLNGDTDNSRWVAGFYYLDIDNKSQAGQVLDFSTLTTFGFDSSTGAIAPAFNDLSMPCFAPPFTGPCPFGIITAGTFHNETVDTTSWAIFGHYEYDLSHTITLIGALRYTEDEREMALTIDNTALFVPLQTFTAANAPNLEQGFENVSAKAEIDWTPDDNWLLYASFTRGHKAGNFAAPFFALVDPADTTSLSHDEEVLHAVELGAKGILWDGRAKLNVSGFYYDYQGYQASFFENLAQIISNLDAEVYGAELELTLNPAEELDFLFGISLIESEVENVGLPTGAKMDSNLPYAPGFSFNALGRYTWPALGGNLTVQGDLNYSDNFCFTVICHDTEKESSYIVGNARITYTSGDDKWSVAVFVRNLGDAEYRVYALDASFAGFTSNAFATPRWFGGTVSYHWN